MTSWSSEATHTEPRDPAQDNAAAAGRATENPDVMYSLEGLYCTIYRTTKRIL
jgi:hypothetical protein